MLGIQKHLDLNLTRAKFDELTADLVEATMCQLDKHLQIQVYHNKILIK